MKRRNFLINSIAAFSGYTLFSGCTKERVITKENSVAKHKFKNTEVPLLGIGCTRLPMDNKHEIDMAELDGMVEYAINHGVNYFDTAYFYVDSKSEIAIGKVLKQYPRDSFLLADKMPVFLIKNKQDIRNIFYEQLKKCEVDYFDFYITQGIDRNNYDTYKNADIHNELLELKKEGKIKYLGFSFLGSTDILSEIVSEGNWDFCQLMINYFDWNISTAKKQYEILQQKKIPVIAVQSLKKGVLVDLPKKASDELKENYPDAAPYEFALRWAASLDNVITVLSSPVSIKQAKHDIEIFEHFKLMNDDEKEFAKKLAKIIQSQGKISCSACMRCIESCPKNINIPAIFAIYNQYGILQNKALFALYYETLTEKERAHNCTKCGLCTKNCSQKLNIPDLIAQVQKEYDGTKVK